MAPSTTSHTGSGLERRELGNASEGELLAAFAAGDRAAAERLVEQSYRVVYALVRRLCGDAELAADLTQESFRKAWDALESFDGRARFSTWLCRIAYNTYLNHLRRPRRLLPLEERVEAAVTDPAPAADEALGQAVAGDRLRRAVLRLPEELRFTVTARYWGDLPVAEIARHEGITGVAIRKRLKRALKALALALEEDV
jgi:RNA polymerase sigma-70 factor (ECF subfamily)